MRPIAEVMEPQPLISPVIVPRALLLPWTEGCEARSAATAEVMILFGLPYHYQKGPTQQHEVREKHLPEVVVLTHDI